MTTHADISEGTRATRREWLGLVVIALPCLVYAMDLTVLNLAIPSITADLQPSAAETLWIVDIYGFLVAGLLITMGTLGDRIGRRRLLLIGAAAFAGASVLAAFATSPEMLIAARALLGFAGATVAPSTLSLIRAMFQNDRQRTVAVGVWISSFSAGAAIGPVAGGALLEVLPWNFVFLLAVPVMGLLLATGRRLLPEYRDPDAGRLDLPSAALSLLAVLSLIYGLKEIATHGAGTVAFVALASGTIIAALFVRRQTRLDDPLVDLGMLKNPAIATALSANTIGFFVVFGSSLLLAQYLQTVAGLSPFVAGLWAAPAALAYVVGSTVTPRLVGRIDPGTAMAAGMVLASAGFVAMAQIEVGSSVGMVVLAEVVFSLGLAVLFTLVADTMVSSAAPEHAGAASALSETSTELGGALGIAVLGAIATAVFQAADPGVETVGAATDPATAAAADAAFVEGFQTVATISAALVLVGAVLVARFLRQPRSRTAAVPCTQVAAEA